MGHTVLIGAAFAVGGALIAFLFLPAREAAPAQQPATAEGGAIVTSTQPAD